MEFWTNLTDREKRLVSFAGALSFFVLLYMGIFRPLVAYHEASELELASAKNTYEAIARGAAVVSALGQENQQTSQNAQQPIRVTVSTAARATGVAISRLQPGDDGSLTVWVETVAPGDLYGWMNYMAVEGGISPAKVIIQKTAADGRLRAQLQFGSNS